jgi:ATP-dependent Lon protease
MSEDNSENSTLEASSPFALLPLRHGTLLPGTSLAIGLGRRQSRALLKAIKPGERIVVGFQHDASVEDPSFADLLPIGVFATLSNITKGPGGSFRVVVNAKERCSIEGMIQSHPYWKVPARPASITNSASTTGEALASLFLDKVKAHRPGQLEELIEVAGEKIDAKKFGSVADLLTGVLGFSSDKDIQILLALDVEERLRLALRFLGEAEAFAEVKSKLSNEVQKQFGKHQREAVLREQLKAIHKELGDEDEASDEDDLRGRLLEADLPEAVQKVVDRVLKRMARGAGPEQNVIRNYLELIADLPWSERAELSPDIDIVAKTLEQDLFGLVEV